MLKIYIVYRITYSPVEYSDVFDKKRVTLKAFYDEQEAVDYKNKLRKENKDNLKYNRQQYKLQKEWEDLNPEPISKDFSSHRDYVKGTLEYYNKLKTLFPKVKCFSENTTFKVEYTFIQ